jgi:6-phosphogluconolactonase
MFKFVRAFFLMSIAAVFLSAAGTTLFAQSPEYAYVSVGISVSAFSIDQTTGALTAIPGSPVQGGGTPAQFSLDPAHHIAYTLLSAPFTVSAPYSVPPAVSAYTIDLTTGMLTLVPGAPFGVAWTPMYLTVGPNGKFAYVIDFGGDYSNNSPSLLTYKVHQDTGALAQSPNRSSLGMPSQNTPGTAIIDPAARFLYMVSCPPPQFGGEGPCAEPSFIYAFAIAGDGSVTPVHGSPYPIGPGLQLAMAVTPNGRFLYLNNGSAYSIDASSGALTPVPGSPFPVATRGRIAMDPQGKFVFLVGCGYHETCVEQIDQSTGALTSVPGSPFQVGGGNLITVDATGHFVYMPNGVDCSSYGIAFACIAAAQVDRTTGALSPVPGSPFPTHQSGTAGPLYIVGPPSE